MNTNTNEIKYDVTGYYYNSNKRFSLCYSNKMFALGINLWRGSVWQITNGKRKLIKRVYN